MSYRIAVLVAWAAAFTSMTSGCSSDVATPFAQATWQVYCTGCGVPAPHVVEGYDGESGLTVDCRLADQGDTRNLSFTLGTRDGSGRPVRLSLQRAQLNASGGTANNASCTVEVLEGGNTYVGECGYGCIVNNVDFGIDETSGRPLITGSIQCTNITPRNNQTLVVDVNGRNARNQPLNFAITDCTGFQP